jgi:hypothetical protein
MAVFDIGFSSLFHYVVNELLPLIKAFLNFAAMKA